MAKIDYGIKILFKIGGKFELSEFELNSIKRKTLLSQIQRT